MRCASVVAAVHVVALYGCAAVSAPVAESGSVESPIVSPSQPARSSDGLEVGGGGLVTLNGTKLFVHREGSGEAAIFVHGGPLLDHGYLRSHLASLGDELELIWYDQRLSGRSEGSVDSASVRLDTFVADIEALRVAIGAERVHLIAHSWGGLLAMKYAIAYPDRLRTLVLLSPMPPSSVLWQEEQAAMARALTAEDTTGAGALRSTPAFAAREPAAVEAVLRHSFRSQFSDPAQAAQLSFHIEPDYAGRSRQFGYMMPDLMSYDLTPQLQGIDVPTLIIYGVDEVGGRIGGERIAAAMPDARLVLLEEAGHFSFIERSGEVLSRVREFLAR